MYRMHEFSKFAPSSLKLPRLALTSLFFFRRSLGNTDEERLTFVAEIILSLVEKKLWKSISRLPSSGVVNAAFSPFMLITFLSPLQVCVFVMTAKKNNKLIHTNLLTFIFIYCDGDSQQSSVCGLKVMNPSQSECTFKKEMLT